MSVTVTGLRQISCIGYPPITKGAHRPGHDRKLTSSRLSSLVPHLDRSTPRRRDRGSGENLLVGPRNRSLSMHRQISKPAKLPVLCFAPSWCAWLCDEPFRISLTWKVSLFRRRAKGPFTYPFTYPAPDARMQQLTERQKAGYAGARQPFKRPRMLQPPGARVCMHTRHGTRSPSPMQRSAALRHV